MRKMLGESIVLDFEGGVVHVMTTQQLSLVLQLSSEQAGTKIQTKVFTYKVFNYKVFDYKVFDFEVFDFEASDYEVFDYKVFDYEVFDFEVF